MTWTYRFPCRGGHAHDGRLRVIDYDNAGSLRPANQDDIRFLISGWDQVYALKSLLTSFVNCKLHLQWINDFHELKILELKILELNNFKSCRTKHLKSFVEFDFRYSISRPCIWISYNARPDHPKQGENRAFARSRNSIVRTTCWAREQVGKCYCKPSIGNRSDRPPHPNHHNSEEMEAQSK